MIWEHVVGFYRNPIQEWHRVDKHHQTILVSLVHIAIFALMPPVMAYLSSVYIGWDVGIGEPIYLTATSALNMSLAMYCALIMGVIALAYLTYWMSHTFGSNPTYAQALELAAYTATPIFMASFVALIPHVWFLMLVGLCAVAYSVYLLYIGVPILMHIPKEQGFIYASSIVTSGLVLLVSIIASSVILWSYGMGPVFEH
ncbi:YIP1 family protein [Photobacterium damselae subsp. damselae]|uniref:YIP1 family protein n=1 Tax=Photobacterium damselae subsp. damselae TaxID=85581 RepID=A0A850QXF6_PHODD|nr:YIP1 family protein [Photobacterium damselae subsp. damselae]